MGRQFESLSLSGSIILIFSFFTFLGVIMMFCRIPEGSDVFRTFSTALATFVTGKKLSDIEKW